jgi:hypothetical protein
MFMRKIILQSTLFLAALLVTVAGNAQSSKASTPSKYKIKGHIEGLKDTSIYLANYYGNKLYYNDTAFVDSKGNFAFDGKPYNECGKYAIVVNNSSRMDIVVDQEEIELEFTPDCRIDAIKV